MQEIDVISLDDMNVGELETLEEIAGVTIGQIMAGKRSMKVLIGFAVVSARRQNPEFSEADARALNLSQLKYPDPPDEGGDAADPTSSKSETAPAGGDG